MPGAPHAVAIDQTYFGRLGSTQSATAPKSASKSRGEGDYQRHPVVHDNTLRVYVLEQAGNIPELHRTGFHIISFTSPRRRHRRRAQAIGRQPSQSRSPDAWRVSQPQPCILAFARVPEQRFSPRAARAIVGTVIVAQTLYSSTKDHLSEFATLRAIGSSNLYIHKVIICQALLSAVIAFRLPLASA